MAVRLRNQLYILNIHFYLKTAFYFLCLDTKRVTKKGQDKNMLPTRSLLLQVSHPHAAKAHTGSTNKSKFTLLLPLPECSVQAGAFLSIPRASLIENLINHS